MVLEMRLGNGATFDVSGVEFGPGSVLGIFDAWLAASAPPGIGSALVLAAVQALRKEVDVKAAEILSILGEIKTTVGEVATVQSEQSDSLENIAADIERVLAGEGGEGMTEAESETVGEALQESRDRLKLLVAGMKTNAERMQGVAGRIPEPVRVTGADEPAAEQPAEQPAAPVEG
jgi:hypothetical protein